MKIGKLFQNKIMIKTRCSNDSHKTSWMEQEASTWQSMRGGWEGERVPSHCLDFDRYRTRLRPRTQPSSL